MVSQRWAGLAQACVLVFISQQGSPDVYPFPIPMPLTSGPAIVQANVQYSNRRRVLDLDPMNPRGSRINQDAFWQ